MGRVGWGIERTIGVLGLLCHIYRVKDITSRRCNG